MTSTRLLLLPLLTSSSIAAASRLFSSSSFTSASQFPFTRKPWLFGKRHQGIVCLRIEDGNEVNLFGGSDDEFGAQVPTQAQTVTEGSGAVLVSEYKPSPDVDYLQELLAIQQQGPRNIGFFGTRNMGFMHQELIEILSYAMVITVKNVIEKPYNDHLPLIEASRLCNMDIISQVQQVICFAFHDSRLLMETCQEAKNLRKIVTLFYLD
ncbi:uncharacterized protein LOC110878447 isoform X2 [Helianthus annuus]|uniref:uncharacterized protein LOC110878447 isoform X2 n=1 Tax=Helianthus annuus TaxID=4232 RepID=UPI000B8F9928|nr:uncharacterized protein LOC110878447 isoform X2 [Helianthus annuus]